MGAWIFDLFLGLGLVTVATVVVVGVPWLVAKAVHDVAREMQKEGKAMPPILTPREAAMLFPFLAGLAVIMPILAGFISGGAAVAFFAAWSGIFLIIAAAPAALCKLRD